MEMWPTTEELENIVQMPHAYLEAKASEYGGTAVHDLEVPTYAGTFTLSASAYGVACVFFPGVEDYDVTERHDKYGFALASWGRQRAIEAGLELMGYMLGEIRHFETPVDLGFLTPFQRDVMGALVSVPYGETITYGELARLAGHPTKARAVGNVMRHNPAPIFVPCHRVVAASGLGGWSGPHGWKEWLLELEAKNR